MRTLSFRRQTRHRNAGFSLIEVLVAIVVLSFGLLGMVGLQAASLQANRDARLQSTAILLARDLAEAMRGNKAVAIAAANPYIGSFQSVDAKPLVPTVASYCLTVGQDCKAGTLPDTATATANAQMTEWLARVSAELPGARVEICKDSAPYGNDGLPQWTCTKASGDPLAIKIGWTRASFRRGATTTANALDKADHPSVMVQVIPGSIL